MAKSHPKRNGGGFSELLRAAWIALKPATFEAVAPCQEGVLYRSPGGRGVAPKIDTYVPTTPVPTSGRPSVLLIHGGGFVVGSRTMKAVRFVATRLVEAGFAVGVPDYRLILRGGRLVEQRDDVAHASDYWCSQVGRHDLDVTQMHLAGLSAGAALALLEASERPDRYSSLTSIYGLYDFAALDGPGRGWLKRRLTRSSDPQQWAALSPAARASDLSLPTIMVHGDQDRLVPFAQAVDVHRRRQQRGLHTTFVPFPGLAHGWLNEAKLDASGELMSHVVAFLQGGYRG